ncbi:hypothetical protein PF005_g27790 [Phytophthora fragariae]|uniref:Uncharacterized protein n=1 Tax=Phytophthora fragariae TaxID=53985 RepID=A0A6A3DRC3_9STRA|nr:hypothetical protein PF003_g36124 [Phytophthora fragariae]KAE8921651.1 hypothetical protein PF009_g28076 [Phytophthora fragariae]KAE9068370.1 hypothetical protein PF007_g27717 [Phytophthora fragariae]KAE9080205.1 hypothetical protein PF006_g27366 [Phytophthora fragariae]KAE9169860.1 hypothetical protein PF005_g27790 [Phytophthora fragariae]
MRDFPRKARGPVLLALGGLRLCPDSGLRARPQIGKCPMCRGAWNRELYTKDADLLSSGSVLPA